jgi:hypothetical protein
MTNPIDLSMQAAGLWFRAASLTVKVAVLPLEVSARVAGAMCERMAAVVASPERTAPEPVEVAVAVPEPRVRPSRRSAPSPKQRRRAARGEPTPGQAARGRRARSEAEAQAAQETDTLPSPGAEVQVDEPWEGYAAMPVVDVLARLQDADAATRAAARLYELAHDGREAVLHATES